MAPISPCYAWPRANRMGATGPRIRRFTRRSFHLADHAVWLASRPKSELGVGLVSETNADRSPGNACLASGPARPGPPPAREAARNADAWRPRAAGRYARSMEISLNRGIFPRMCVQVPPRTRRDHCLTCGYVIGQHFATVR